MKIKAFVPELERIIEVWTLQVGKDCYFVRELTSLYHEAPQYTVSNLIFEETEIHEDTRADK